MHESPRAYCRAGSRGTRAHMPSTLVSRPLRGKPAMRPPSRLRDANDWPIDGPAIPLTFTARPIVAVLGVHHVHSDGMCMRGGAEKYLRHAVGGLLEAGASVHVNFSGDPIYDGLNPSGIGQRLVLEQSDWLDDRLHGDEADSIRRIVARARWLRSTNADVLFVVQQRHGRAFEASVLAAAMIGCPVVMSIRQAPEPDEATGEVSADERFGLWRRLPAWRMRTIARCCRAVIFNSRRIARQYVQRYGLDAARVRIIANGEAVASAPRSRRPPNAGNLIHPRRAGRVMLGSVSQLAAHKGPDLTLRAFARLAPRFENADLTLFGDGPLRSELQQQAAELGLSHRVTLAGYTTDRDAAYDSIDVFVLPSRRESSSNAVIEAMARGLPCIVSDVGGLPELVAEGRTGRVVRANDVDGLERAMADLLSDADMAARMGDAAFRQAAACFDPAERTRELLETLLPGWTRAAQSTTQIGLDQAISSSS